MVKKPVLSVRNLTTQLRIGSSIYTVVDSLSFDLYKGKTLALVGESGCGKSMTALSILRIVPEPPALLPTGEVLYEGKNLLTMRENELRKIRGDRIAMIFQDPMSALNPVYTVGFQLMEVVNLHLNLYGEEARKRLIYALEEVKIDRAEQCLESYPHQLSGGMKQRVMIAMALLCEPDILIADEPTTALDVTVQRQVLQIIQELQQRHGMALLLITHDMGVVAEMADEVIVMYATQSVETGSVYDIFDHREHPYTIGLFNSLPLIQGQKKERLKSIEGTVPQVGHLPLGCYFADRCPHVMSICRKGPVPIFEERKNHFVRCWLAEPGRASLPLSDSTSKMLSKAEQPREEILEEEKESKKTRRRYDRLRRLS